MSRIVSLGAATQDIFLVDRDDFVETPYEDISIFGKLAIGSKVDIDKAIFSVGGSGANAAVTFARSGHETIYIGTLARDTAGEAVLRCLDEENIDNSYVEFMRGATACSVILLDAKTSQRTVLEYRGISYRANRLHPEDLVGIQPDWLYVSSLGGDMDKLLEFFVQAHTLGAKVMFNPGPAELDQPAKLIGLLQDTDVLLVNKDEAAKIVPGVILTELLARLSNYCPITIITDGIMGAIATDHRETFRLGVYEQATTRDITGAGDAFGSGFLAKYADNADFATALRFAAANASKVTQHYGAEAGILSGDYDLHPMPIMKIDNLTEWATEGGI